MGPTSHRTRAQAAWLSACLLVSLLPVLLFFGHSLAPVTSPDADAGHLDTHTSEHARHCHQDLASCADVPVTAGPGQLLLRDQLLPSARFIQTLLPRRNESPLPRPAASPLTPPPTGSVSTIKPSYRFQLEVS